MGHIIPGTFFIGLSLWWIYSILYRYIIFYKIFNKDIILNIATDRYYKCRITHQEGNYRNSATFPTVALSRVPVEAIFKVVASSIGIAGGVHSVFYCGHVTSTSAQNTLLLNHRLVPIL